VSTARGGVGVVGASAVSLDTDWSRADGLTTPAGRVKELSTSLGLKSSDTEVSEPTKTKELCTPKAGATIAAESPMARVASPTAFLVLNVFIIRTD
jgi:hypothetical protein